MRVYQLDLRLKFAVTSTAAGIGDEIYSNLLLFLLLLVNQVHSQSGIGGVPIIPFAVAACSRIPVEAKANVCCCYQLKWQLTAVTTIILYIRVGSLVYQVDPKAEFTSSCQSCLA